MQTLDWGKVLKRGCCNNSHTIHIQENQKQTHTFNIEHSKSLFQYNSEILHFTNNVSVLF